MPQTLVDGSICQPSPFLYDASDEPSEGYIKSKSDDKTIFIKPSFRANRLVAYLESLKQDYELPEIAFSETDDEDLKDVDATAASVDNNENFKESSNLGLPPK